MYDYSAYGVWLTSKEIVDHRRENNDMLKRVKEKYGNKTPAVMKLVNLRINQARENNRRSPYHTLWALEVARLEGMDPETLEAELVLVELNSAEGFSR